MHWQIDKNLQGLSVSPNAFHYFMMCATAQSALLRVNILSHSVSVRAVTEATVGG
jgi:hypothetical protein